ncbi:hypothetical protein LEP1GSC108_0142 [Leptospira weilii str. UI 13098]|uniref:Integrase core domain protein n=1 Tax=Leptospira weilii str. UI 13098 TaxID=1088542 RepID=M6Q2L6_9LEPT|nr:hypothetical protein LEP1GSC108_0142 [Leptospira weilii str. UI 13098]
METGHLLKAFGNVLSRRGYPKESIFYSDRGMKYASEYFRKFLSANEFILSMSRKDNCYDNAPGTRFIARVPPEFPRIAF